MTDEPVMSALERLTKLRDSSALTEAEFIAQKSAILGSVSALHVRFYRRLWFIVLLTGLMIPFPIAMILLLTGDIYRKKDGLVFPIRTTTRYVYGGLLALWLVAVTLKVLIQPGELKQEWANSADPDKPAATPSTTTNTASASSTELDACDSTAAAEMVKGALESSADNNVTIKVLDYGNAHETWYEKPRQRRCWADAVLNTGATKLAFQVFRGPSGAEMVQVEQGDAAEHQIMADQFKKEVAESLAKEAQAGAAGKTEATTDSEKQSANDPAPHTADQRDAADDIIQALEKQYIGKGFEDAEPNFVSSGWREMDSDIGYQIFQKGRLTIRVEYVPTGRAQITKISRIR